MTDRQMLTRLFAYLVVVAAIVGVGALTVSRIIPPEVGVTAQGALVVPLMFVGSLLERRRSSSDVPPSSPHAGVAQAPAAAPPASARAPVLPSPAPARSPDGSPKDRE